MNSFFKLVQSRLAALSTGTRVVLAVCIPVAVLACVFVARWASQPSFELLYSGLEGRELGPVQSALASADVRYRVSQPPGPFVVHVDANQYYVAQNAVAIAGALDRAPEGISAGIGGASDLFQSSEERAQSALKREWQELEKQIEELDFVERARVSTSIPERTALRKPGPITVAVALTLRGRVDLTRAQANTVARLARFRFNVPSKNVLVTDQGGRALMEDGSENDDAAVAQEMFDHARSYDADLERKANEALQRVFGAAIAHVVVHSSWTQEELESVKESLDPKSKVVVSETSSKSTTTGPSSPVVGADALADTGTDVSTSGESSSGSSVTNESSKTTLVGRETELRKSRAPHLDRVSLSLFLDESLKERQAEVEAAVKGAVGFDEKRGDTFAAMVAPFATVERDAQGQPVPPKPPVVEAPSRWLEFLLQRAVEIAALGALGFLLLRVLRAPKKSLDVDPPRPEGVDEERWTEMLARSRVEELVRTDPERVATVLSRWIAEDEIKDKRRTPQTVGR
ncbi:MAG: flagellar M-ring protein FliF C-terminal domain-containing protein [Planctomycetota bacterium]